MRKRVQLAKRKILFVNFNCSTCTSAYWVSISFLFHSFTHTPFTQIFFLHLPVSLIHTYTHTFDIFGCLHVITFHTDFYFFCYNNMSLARFLSFFKNFTIMSYFSSQTLMIVFAFIFSSNVQLSHTSEVLTSLFEDKLRSRLLRYSYVM